MFSKFRRARNVSLFSQKLGKLTSSVNDFMSSNKENDLNTLISYCEKQKDLKKILDKHEVTTEELKSMYSRLLMAGAGQWIDKTYIPVAAICFPSSLEYLCENKESEDFREIAFNVLSNFQKNT